MFHKLIYICFFFFGIFPLLPFKLKGLPILILGILAIIVLLKKKVGEFPLREFIIISSLFSIQIISLLNTFSFPWKNIETILSNLEQKATFIGGGKLNTLEKIDFENLIIEIKKNVRTMVSVHENEANGIVTTDIVNELVHTDFASWIGQAERKYPIELFTTNYDFLFELGLESKEVPYYDGFCGSLRPFFNPESRRASSMSFSKSSTKPSKPV